MPPTPTEPIQVFIIRDFSVSEITDTLQHLVKIPPPGYKIIVPGLRNNRPQGLIFGDNIRPQLEASHKVIALADLPNVNVGFELGYALGIGKRSLLASSRPTIPEWVRDYPPFNGYFVSFAGSLDRLEELITQDAFIPIEPPSEAQGDLGTDTLFLCPEGLGEPYARIRRSRCKDWITLAGNQFAWDRVPELFRSVGRVVWVLPPTRKRDTERDDVCNATNAALAGFAKATGRELVILKSDKARYIADVANEARVFHDIDGYEQLLEKLASGRRVSRPDSDVVANYRQFLANVHSELVPFFSEWTDVTLGQVYVELELEADASSPRFSSTEMHRRESTVSLQELLELRDAEGQLLCGRWVVLGEPGAGKSTACRYLCHALASDPDGPIPVYVSVARLAESGQGPFALAEEDLRKTQGEANSLGLAERMREAAETPGKIWLLLDGLDEVPKSLIATLRQQLTGLVKELPLCQVVVTSRDAGYRDLGSNFRRARVKVLSPAKRRKLLLNWLPDKGPAVWNRLKHRPALLDLVGNPLMLTLAAKLAAETDELPQSRIELYDRAIDLLLRRGHCVENRGVRDSYAAKEILLRLSHKLQTEGSESWTEEELQKTLWELRREDPQLRDFLTLWDSPEQFLNDIANESGLLGPRGGPNELWGYLHHSFREYLTARMMARLGMGRYLEQAKSLARNPEDVPHWGETFALLCSVSKEPHERIQLLEQLRATSDELFLRTLSRSEGIEPTDAAELLFRTSKWDGEHLAVLIRRWLADGQQEGAIKDILRKEVHPKQAIEKLAFLYYGMEGADVSFEREQFFQACNHDTSGVPSISLVQVPPTPSMPLEFEMGSSEENAEEWEAPTHMVRLSSFWISATPVTQNQFAHFDRSKEINDPDAPVTNVSWWEAWLFCKWIGGELPSEAQWEFACRAGCSDAWSSGADEKALHRIAHFGASQGTLPSKIGTREANAWGIFDMHGNACEWCADWYGPYPDGLQIDPEGPRSGTDRVIRGGSCLSDPLSVRSASRDWSRPWFRSADLGFRVVFEAANTTPASP